MNKTSQKGFSQIVSVLYIVGVVALVCLAGYGLLHLGSSGTNGRGGTSNADSMSLGSNLNVGNTFTLGTNGGSVGDTGYNSGVGRNEQFAYGTCPSTATSTPISLANPFAATSTFTVNSFNVLNVGQATSTTFEIGTSTKISATAITDISPSGGLFSVGSTTNLYLTPGIPGQNPTTNTVTGNRTFVVGANDKVLVWATTTAGTLGSAGGATSYSGINACTLKGTWTN